MKNMCFLYLGFVSEECKEKHIGRSLANTFILGKCLTTENKEWGCKTLSVFVLCGEELAGRIGQQKMRWGCKAAEEV